MELTPEQPALKTAIAKETQEEAKRKKKSRNLKMLVSLAIIGVIAKLVSRQVDAIGNWQRIGVTTNPSVAGPATNFETFIDKNSIVRKEDATDFRIKYSDPKFGELNLVRMQMDSSCRYRPLEFTTYESDNKSTTVVPDTDVAWAAALAAPGATSGLSPSNGYRNMFVMCLWRTWKACT